MRLLLVFLASLLVGQSISVGVRADELTPELAPNYFALARSGVAVVA